MSDFYENRRWLEQELTRQFGPAEAPPDLWNRIRRARDTRPARVREWGLWPVLTAALLLASCILVREIGRASAEVEFRSADPAAVRSWVKNNTGVDFDLPATQHGNVRITGARLIRSGGRAVQIECRVSGHPATLLARQTSGIQTIAWSITGPTAAACQHCHAEAHDKGSGPQL